MSKVKIKGNSSGTGVLTIEAPNTNTDRTITLPDGTGELIQADGSGNVGIGTGSPDANLHLKSSATNLPVLKLENTYESGGGTATVTGNAPIIELYANDSGTAQPDSQELGIIEFRGANKDSGAEELYTRIVGTNGDANTTGELKFETQQSNTMTTALTIRGDRGLSQFTAKAWARWVGTGTLSVTDSHNVSSVTDVATGRYRPQWGNTMSNANYTAFCSSTWPNWDTNNLVHDQADTYVEVSTLRSGGSDAYEDNPNVSCIIFGD